jgi:hypothetical protein
MDWGWDKWVVFLLPFALLAVGAITVLALRNTIRTRLRVARQLRDDPDINEWLVAFGWSRKVLYGPTIFLSAVAWLVMLLFERGWLGSADSSLPVIVGGVWLAVFVLNFLIDEYEISVKLLLLVVLVVLALGLWLGYLHWLMPFLGGFRGIRASLSSTVYLILALLFLLAIAVSWVRGLFFYVAITPNYMNIQTGPTETGEQIARQEYSTRVDTGDFLERLLGFGRVVITFADHRRQPMVLLVGRIGRKAKLLESIQGKLAVDRRQPGREGAMHDL